MVPLLMSEIIIKNNNGDCVLGNTTQNWTVFAYTTWYSNIVGSVSQELEELYAKFTGDTQVFELVQQYTMIYIVKGL